VSSTPVELVSNIAALSGSERLLLVTPGPHGAQLLPALLKKFSQHPCTAIESNSNRLSPLKNGASGKLNLVVGRATRLPFLKHSFDAVISFEALYSIRPPWTVIAELHRVLVPDGKLILSEPASHGALSALRDKISGPGKRVFSIEELKFRLARADWEIQQVEDGQSVSGMRHPMYFVRAIKKENPVEPVPQFLTAKEMMERRKKKVPEGEELP
jgi:ubiquinone/menaquinone biosynthesis C-methylase UbiE